MNTNVTIADVAREAGVSTQTVSRVINGSPAIRPATRQRVLDAIERLDYRPNAVARSLATDRTSTIGIVVADIGNAFFTEIVRGAEDTARAHGYHLFLVNTDQDPAREFRAIRALQDQRVDGIILCASRLPEDQLRTVLNGRQGVVLVNKEYVCGAIGSVRGDDHQGTVAAIDHFRERGRKRIVFLAGQPGGPSHRIRMDTFEYAMASSQVPDEMAITIQCPSTPTGGYEATLALLNSSFRADALLCFNDLVAIGALHACIEQGVMVPDDIALVGHGDILLASFVHPGLTTITYPIRELGRHAVSMLVSHLKGRDYDKDVVLEASLILRASSP